ncbi:hypothetical protein [Psychrobacter aestuarii]|nr:hypothetical protein [Psychrobacter aestuarii]
MNNNNDDAQRHPPDLTTDTNGRQGDIYERFLERMQQIEGGNASSTPQDSVLDHDAFEPLSDEELQMFAEFNEQTEVIAARYDAEHPEEVAAEHQPPPTFDRVEAGGFEDENAALSCPLMTVEPPEPAPHTLQKKKPVTKTSKHVLRGLMLLIIGIVSGVIISALAIFALDPDVLTTVMGDDNANTDTPAVMTTDSASTPAPATTATQAVAPENTTTASDTDASTTAASDNAAAPTPVTADNAPITYEDFREEAQTTLYRDTSK